MRFYKWASRQDTGADKRTTISWKFIVISRMGRSSIMKSTLPYPEAIPPHRESNKERTKRGYKLRRAGRVRAKEEK
jgi:hypothetical protein